jgi:hypothetical protein
MNIEPRPQLRTVITAHDPNEFRESLPESGVFDIFDCRLLIEFSPHAVIQDLEKYVTILESCINIVDMDIQPNYLLSSDGEVKLTISEVPLHVAENRTPPTRMYERPARTRKPRQTQSEDGFDKD